jgi:hypothetical protein
MFMDIRRPAGMIGMLVTQHGPDSTGRALHASEGEAVIWAERAYKLFS